VGKEKMFSRGDGKILGGVLRRLRSPRMGERSRAQAAKILEGFSNASPKKIFRHPLKLSIKNEKEP
jgi:hypothetical protein